MLYVYNISVEKPQSENVQNIKVHKCSKLINLELCLYNFIYNTE